MCADLGSILGGGKKISKEAAAGMTVSDEDAAGNAIDWVAYVDKSPGLTAEWNNNPKVKRDFGTKELFGKSHYAVWGKEHGQLPLLVGGGKPQTPADLVESLLPKKAQAGKDPIYGQLQGKPSNMIAGVVTSNAGLKIDPLLARPTLGAGSGSNIVRKKSGMGGVVDPVRGVR